MNWWSKIAVKLCVIFLGGILLVSLQNKGSAVTEDSTNSVNLQGTVNQSMELTNAVMASKELVGVGGGTAIDLGTYSAAGFTPGAEFAGAGTRFKNFTADDSMNACISISTGFEWEQMGQGDINDLILFSGVPGDANVGIFVQTHTFANGQLATPLGDAPGTSFDDTCGWGGFTLDNTFSGFQDFFTAGIFLRNATGDIKYRVLNMNVGGLRDHTVQVKVETTP